jgi:hypothetical protein
VKKLAGTLLLCLLMARSMTLGGDRPGHLEPIEPYWLWGEDYYQTVFHTLLEKDTINRRTDLFMMVLPAEYAVVLRDLSTSGDSLGTFELEYSIASAPIWKRTKDSGQEGHDRNRDFSVDRQSSAIAESAAVEIIGIWREIIEQTRYAKKNYLGLDGVTYHFFVSPNLYGGTWSPDSGDAKLIVDLGEMLIKYVKSANGENDGVIERSEKLMRQIRNRVDKTRSRVP